jgi:hypothetical protein
MIRRPGGSRARPPFVERRIDDELERAVPQGAGDAHGKAATDTDERVAPALSPGQTGLPSTPVHPAPANAVDASMPATATRWSPQTGSFVVRPRVFFAGARDRRDSVALLLGRALTNASDLVEERVDRPARFLGLVREQSNCTGTRHGLVVMPAADDIAEAQRLGYLVGQMACALGPTHVTVLYPFEHPPAFGDTALSVTKLDGSGGWRQNVVRDLRESHIEISGNWLTA